ncbi:MAG: DNA-binding protein WhiA [Candidatus Eremiobacteraeota bacterium]|nr:DNA-binding protein WhiA [Candidatus Eremiobacteraeota bacterium]MBC5802250.1 DNA-binding protein WhiA [Candidatus Eremiobacteraeota bacterium]MBC5822931.1 DNA-binding protein WhiA [Candidatus Eremiobacteraeota bacterium]
MRARGAAAPAPTLSADAKDALAREPVTTEHGRAALREGLFFFGTQRRLGIFHTRRAAVARLAWTLLTESAEPRAGAPIPKRAQRTPTYELAVAAVPALRKTNARTERRMVLRGAFLACGSLAAPARGYHLEFVPPDADAAQRLLALLRAEGLEPRIAPREARRIVYFKDVDAIAQVLAAIGAGSALLQLEGRRAVKETKNRIHRLVNMEAANVDRATSAATAQREVIAFLADAYGLARLPAPLRSAAELRLAYPAETLAELARRCDPIVNKSTMGARIAALVRLAQKTGMGTGEKGSSSTSV